MHTTLNKQTSFFVAFSFTLVFFSTCKKDDGECNTANVPTIEWKKTISGNHTITISNTQQTTDGGYILAGHNNGNQNDLDYWIAKLNSNTDIEWEKTYGGSDYDNATNIQQTTDGGYIVAGYSRSANGDVTNNKGGSDAWILKLNTNGGIEWQKTYGGSADDYLSSIKQTIDNGYIAVGSTTSNNGDVPNNQGYYDAWIIKIADNGNLQWSKTFGGIDLDGMHDVQQTIDDGYLIIGQTSSNNGDVTDNHGNLDCWVIKLQTNGNLEWQKTYGGSGDDSANYIQKTNDGHYIIAGETNSSDGDISSTHENLDTWVVKIDNLGAILQQTTVGTNDNEVVSSVLQTQDNNLLIAGYSLINNFTGPNAFIAALNTNYTLLWQQQIPQENISSSANAIFETPDCGYIVFGNKIFKMD
jgi:hypothetical protein